MLRKRLLLSTFLLRTGLLRLANASGKSTLTIFGYHRIRPRHFHTWFDDGVFDAPHAEAFRKHLTWIKQYADPVSEQDLLDTIWGRTRLPKRAFLITFDDGYRDNLKVAAPILKELGIPALFFIPTEPINERRLGWWDLIAWCLKKTEKTEIQFRGKTYSLEKGIEAADHEFKQMMKLEAA
ncbi:MAG: polysaccharide deacetylase family protein, partial [candidate division WOR-3 bacterium]